MPIQNRQVISLQHILELGRNSSDDAEFFDLLKIRQLIIPSEVGIQKSQAELERHSGLTTLRLSCPSPTCVGMMMPEILACKAKNSSGDVSESTNRSGLQ